mgnify:CR=1 FL=1|tara:strand:+ start:142 stop:540 length:399 start_codon:yes stop_codon:yes gene_type:complete
MSWATCYSGSNNIHFDSPPLMSDGRHLTNWDPSCDSNERLQKYNGINSNYSYRQYLINNGLNIIKQNNSKFFDNYNISDYFIKSGNKYLVKSYSDTNTRFGYETSDLKNKYMSREFLNSKLSAPIFIKNEDK